MSRLRARWLVLVLGGILLATAVLFGGAGNAEAQSQGKGKEKSQVQGQGQGKGKSQVQGQEKSRSQGGGEVEGGNGQNKVTLCHKGKNTITVGAPAVQAHLAHLDSTGPCESSTPTTPTDCETDPLAEAEVTVTQLDPTATTIEVGDELTIETPEDLDISEDWSLVLTDDGGTTTTTLNSDNATIKEDNGQLVVTIEEILDPAISPEGVTVESSTGICAVGGDTGGGTATTLTGKVAETKDGNTVLRTASGDIFNLETTGEKREKLKKLKGQQVTATGKLDKASKKLKVKKITNKQKK